MLSGTAIPTQRIVSQNACSPSGLVMASIGSWMPFSNVFTKIITSGITSSAAR